MIEELEGKFWLQGESYFGALLLSGKSSKLRLFGDKQFAPVPDAYRSIRGELFDGRHVSVIGCVLERIENAGMRTAGAIAERQTKSVATLFPHYVALGDRTISESDVVVQSVSFFMKDALSVFYEFDYFGSVLDPLPFKDRRKGVRFIFQGITPAKGDGGN